jgi:pimeloyl-ACP methyl ester carboxylesterase
MSTNLVTGGVRLELAQWPGRGPPVLMLHEGLGSVSMWRDFPERLAKASGREVIAWSRRGYGASDRLPESREPDYMHREADGVVSLMDNLGIDRADLLGHSDGASIALIVAAQAPDRVASLVLEAPHVMVEDVTVASIAAVKSAFQTTDLAARLRRHHADPEHVFWRWNDIWLDARFRSWTLEPLLGRIAAPALLIQGLDDEYGTLDQLDRIQAVLPRTQRLELEACGHSPHRDHPERVIQACLTFWGNDPARSGRPSRAP